MYVTLISIFMLTVIGSQNSDYEAALTAYERGDYDAAYRGFVILARDGHAGSQYGLGLMYFQGAGVQRNLPEATRWFRLAAEQGEEYAKLMLGICLNALGEFEEATPILEWAAGKGDASAQTLLGIQYVAGNGVPQDMRKAARLFQLAADQGNAAAQVKLGQFYALGEGGLQQNLSKARAYIRRAAEQDDSQGQAILGEMLYYGRGGAEDPNQAMSWWLKAAANGDVDASYYLGIAYYEGKASRGVDYGESFRWFAVAADAGNAASQHNLGTMYYHGQGASKDLVQALRWLLLADAQGYEASRTTISLVVSEMTPAQVAEAKRLAGAQR